MIGKRLDSYLRVNSISQQALADKVNVSHEVISNICVNNADVDAILYYRICKVLGVSLDTFLED